MFLLKPRLTQLGRLRFKRIKLLDFIEIPPEHSLEGSGSYEKIVYILELTFYKRHSFSHCPIRDNENDSTAWRLLPMDIRNIIYETILE